MPKYHVRASLAGFPAFVIHARLRPACHALPASMLAAILSCHQRTE